MGTILQRVHDRNNSFQDRIRFGEDYREHYHSLENRKMIAEAHSGVLTPTMKTEKLNVTFEGALNNTLEKGKLREAAMKESKKKNMLELQMSQIKEGMACKGPEIRKVFDNEHRDLPRMNGVGASLMQFGHNPDK